MPVEAIITGGASGLSARVNREGALAVGRVKYDLSSFNNMAVDDQVYNFYTPRPAQQFVITGMKLRAGFGVSNAADATVEIFEAPDVDSATVSKVIHTELMTRSTAADMFPLNLLVSEGVWVNGRTDDNSVSGTIFGYYIDVETT